MLYAVIMAGGDVQANTLTGSLGLSAARPPSTAHGRPAHVPALAHISTPGSTQLASPAPSPVCVSVCLCVYVCVCGHERCISVSPVIAVGPIFGLFVLC